MIDVAELSWRTIRDAWRAYLGAGVALLFGTTLLATAVSAIAAAGDTQAVATVAPHEHDELEGLASMFGFMATTALFLSLFVVGSTFGFVLASRHRQLGLLRLLGATPSQVRRLVLCESMIVALGAVVLGCLLQLAATPVLFAALRRAGILTIDLEAPDPWVPWLIAGIGCLLVALVGSWRASRRAASIPPAAALREARVERRRPTWWQLLIGISALATVPLTLLVAPRLDALGAMIVSLLLPQALVVGLYNLGGVVFPSLAALAGHPAAARSVAARLARDHVRAGARAAAAIAAPVLAISAIAGSLVVTGALSADFAAAVNRAALAAPVVVDLHGDDQVAPLLASAGVTLLDVRRQVEVSAGAESGSTMLDVVDPSAVRVSRGLAATAGSLDGLPRSGLAVTDAWVTDTGLGLGSSVTLALPSGVSIEVPVVAIVPDSPDLYGDLIADAGTLPAPFAEAATTDLAFVDPGTVDLDAVLQGTAATVAPAAQWLQQVDRRTRAANDLGLWVLLGPAGLYAAIAVVNAVLMGQAARRAQLVSLHRLGATGPQLRQMMVWEAALVGGTGLLLGGAITAFVWWLIHQAMPTVPDQTTSVPWGALTAIGAGCIGLTVLAATIGAWRSDRGLARPA